MDKLSGDCLELQLSWLTSYENMSNVRITSKLLYKRMVTVVAKRMIACVAAGGGETIHLKALADQLHAKANAFDKLPGIWAAFCKACFPSAPKEAGWFLLAGPEANRRYLSGAINKEFGRLPAVDEFMALEKALRVDGDGKSDQWDSLCVGIKQGANAEWKKNLSSLVGCYPVTRSLHMLADLGNHAHWLLRVLSDGMKQRLSSLQGCSKQLAFDYPVVAWTTGYAYALYTVLHRTLHLPKLMIQVEDARNYSRDLLSAYLTLLGYALTPEHQPIILKIRVENTNYAKGLPKIVDKVCDFLRDVKIPTLILDIEERLFGGHEKQLMDAINGNPELNRIWFHCLPKAMVERLKAMKSEELVIEPIPWNIDLQLADLRDLP